MTRKDLDLKYFEKKLLEQKERVVNELKSVGRVNPDNPSDWEATAGEQEENNTSDKNDFADSIEEYEENTAILKELETELSEIEHALKRIDSGTYGICEKTGKEISKDRLEAYPAARTIVEK